MKLDATVMRTMAPADFIVLAAVEEGMADHALVPLPLISNLAKLRHGGVHKIVSSLLRDKLLSHERKQGGYDGYRVTTAGYDILALRALKQQKYRGNNGDDGTAVMSLSKAPPLIAALGPKIGTGKESDIYLAVNGVGEQVVLKFHRLGRTSFRSVQKKRDYGPKQQSQAHSWLFLSRASAVKEFAFMKALHQAGYPTPTPIAHNRHVVCMNLVRGMPLYQIYPQQLNAAQAESIYQQAVAMLKRLASKHGLVHCDLNEFNLLVDLSGIQATATSNKDDPYVRHSGQSVVSAPSAVAKLSAGSLTKPAWEQSLEEQHDNIEQELPEPAERLRPGGEPKPIVTLIDFPQMISTSHVNAQELYERDLNCLQRFFTQKLQCQIPDEALQGTSWKEVMGIVADGNDDNDTTAARLDAELKASGFHGNDSHLELYYFNSHADSVEQAKRHGISVVEEGDEQDSEEEEEEEESDDNDNNNINNDREAMDNLGSLSTDNDVGLDPEVQQQLDSSNNNSPEQNDDDDDLQSLATTNTTMRATQQAMARMDLGNMTAAERKEMAAKVKQRVKKQLEEQKRKARTSGAYRAAARNKNKQYVKGKRVLKESLM